MYVWGSGVVREVGAPAADLRTSLALLMASKNAIRNTLDACCAASSCALADAATAPARRAYLFYS